MDRATASYAFEAGESEKKRRELWIGGSNPPRSVHDVMNSVKQDLESHIFSSVK